MRKQLDENSSRILESSIKSSGIVILLNTEVNEVIGESKVEGFKARSGEIYEFDTIIYSIGTKPNIDFLKNTPINTNKGITVNEKMETNIKDIFAAGDVAEYNNIMPGLWNIAIGQGMVAGYNMVGVDTKYGHITPVTTLSAFGLPLFSMGIVDESKATNIILEDKSDENIYNKILIDKNKIIGAIVVGNIKSSPALKSAIEKEISLEGIEYQNMTVDDIIQVLKSK